jgi:putative restriction endonuclease
MAFDPAQRFIDLGTRTEPQSAYGERLTRERLHQPVFRASALSGYDDRCAICQIHPTVLLDPAHIILDGQPLGDRSFRTVSPFAKSITAPLH